MELQKGRPADTAGRLEKEIRTYDLLDRLGVTYERVDHAPAMTMESVRRSTRRCRRSSARICSCVIDRKQPFIC